MKMKQKLKTFPVSKITGFEGNVLTVKGDKKLYSYRGTVKKGGKIVGVKVFPISVSVTTLKKGQYGFVREKRR